MKCNRSVGNVLKNGNLEFSNSRVLSYETLQHNFDNQTGREVLFQRVLEKRSLLGKYEASKRVFIDRKFSASEPPIKKIDEELHCFQAQIYPECELCALEDENLPLIVADEDDIEDTHPIGGGPAVDEWIRYDNFLQRDNLSQFSDAFFDQETLPFPFNMMPNNMPDVILPDYESVSHDIEYFTQPYFSPPNVYHFVDDDFYHYVPPLRVDTHSLYEDELNSTASDDNYQELENVFYNRPNSLSSDNLSELELPISELDPELIEYCMDFFPDNTNSTIVWPFPVKDETEN